MKKNGTSSLAIERKNVSRIFYKGLCCFLAAYLCIGVAYAQDKISEGIGQKTVTLGFTNERLDNALSQLEKASGFRLVYPSEPVEKARLVNLPAQERTVSATLKLILQGSNLDFRQSGNSIVLFSGQAQAASVAAQQTSGITVSGVVKDEFGEPLPGAVVLVKNTKQNVSANNEGVFEIKDISPNAVLLVTFLGYKIQEYPINGQAKVEIAMDPEATALEEVVVTGYQTIAKERATGAYEILGAKTMDKTINLSATGAIEGKMAGVVVQGDNILIRGRSTLSSNVGTNPLIVIDGLPTERSINDINMNDVESFTVLKDAAASSIYGVRAANGVIVITTKKAQVGKTSINVSGDWQWVANPSLSDYGYASTSDLINYEMNYWDKVVGDAGKTDLDYFNTEIRGLNNDAKYFSPLATLRLQRAQGIITPTQFEETIGQWRTNDYRQEYMDNAWRTPFRQSYNVSIGNANERQNTSFNFYFIDNKAQNIAVNNSNFKTNLKTTQKITKWLSVDFGIDAQYGKSQSQFSAYTGFTNLEAYTPILDADDNRVYREYSSVLGSTNNINSRVVEELNALNQTIIDPAARFDSYNFNVLDELDRNKTNAKSLNVRTWGQLTFDLYKGLKFKSSLSYESRSNNTERLYESDSYYMRYHRNRMMSQSGSSYIKNLKDGGMFRQTGSGGHNYVFRNQVEYKGEIAKNHSINAVGGIELQEKETDINSLIDYLGYDPQTLGYWTNPNLDLLLTTGVNSYVFGTTGQKITDMYSTAKPTTNLHRYVGIYATAGYSYKNLYNLSGSFRIDQADLFGTDPKYRYRPLWSVGAGWQMSNEAFMKDIRWIDKLSVSGSYGVTGNVDQNSSPYVTASSGTSSTNFLANTSRSTFIIDANAPNPLLRWEKTNSYGGVIDFSLFKQLLSGKIEAYYKYSEDLLAKKSMESYSLGFSEATVNNGAMSNKGVEFTLRSPWFTKQDWRLTSSLIMSYNKNTVESISYAPSTASDLVNNTYYLEGRPRNSLYAYRYGGLTTGGTDAQNGAPIIIKADGTVLYEMKADGTLSIPTPSMSPEDVVYMGSLEPLWTGSFNQQVAYKNWELSFMFTYSGGNKMRKPTYDFGDINHAPLGGVSGDIVNAWTPSNIRSDIPKTYIYYGLGTTTSSVSSIMNYWRQSDVNVVPADIIRLRNIALSYRLPEKYAKKIGMQNLKLTGQINNLWFWSAAGNNIDPDTQGANSSTLMPPTPISYLLRLEVNF